MTRASIASQLTKNNREILNAAKARARVRLAELTQAEQNSDSNDRSAVFVRDARGKLRPARIKR